LIGQIRREGLQARELFVSVRFNDFQRVGCKHRFQHPQFRNTVINDIMEKLYWKAMLGGKKSIRQICLGFSNLQKLEAQPMLWGSTDAERWNAIDYAFQHLEDRFGKNAIMTGAQFALKVQNGSFGISRAKCPFGLHEANPAGPIRLDSKKANRFLKNM
jgi:hypothetical protein